jgi:hypothetical protein
MNRPDVLLAAPGKLVKGGGEGGISAGHDVLVDQVKGGLLVPWARLERATYCLGGSCSIR